MSTELKYPEWVRFAAFEFDYRTGDLRRDGISLKLQPQPARVLAVLIRRAGEVVTRRELAEEVWGSDTFVDFEQGLNYAIRQIRSALGDDTEHPRFLETLPKRGYRFIAPLEYRVTTEKVVAQPATSAASSPARIKPRLLFVLLAILGIATVMLATYWQAARTRLSTRQSRIESLAVLPLRNLSQDPEQEYFSDGMTDELITDLAKLGGLRVISHTSVERYKQTKRPLPEVARELGVDAIVEGTVLRSNDRVRITAQLIEARSDRHLWAESYERNLGDVLVLQGRLAQDIAEEVRLKLTPQVQSRLTNTIKTTPTAYDAYLRGRYLWNKRNAQAISEAIQYFEKAVREDPNFAPAYSGLADCYWTGWGATLNITLAEEYARKALSLEPDLGEGHDSLGQVFFFEHRMSDAGNELKRALVLNPNSAFAHHLYASYLLSVGRPSDALAESDRARQLDPFSAPVNNMRAIILIDCGKYDEALEQAVRVAEIIPQSQWAYQQLARIYWLKGDVLRAIEEQKKTAVLAHAPEWLQDQDTIMRTYKNSGEHAALAKAARLMEQTRSVDFDGIWAAFAFGSVGDATGALRCLERTLREGVDGNLQLQLQTAPEFDFLRTDPRYLDLRHRLGFDLSKRGHSSRSTS